MTVSTGRARQFCLEHEALWAVGPAQALNFSVKANKGSSTMQPFSERVSYCLV